jgi:hypothetical protein
VNALQSLEDGGIQRLYRRFTQKDASEIVRILKEIMAKKKK